MIAFSMRARSSNGLACFFLWVFLPLVFLPAGGLGAARADSGSKAANAKKIGVVAPLTGTGSTFGLTVRNSVVLASENFDPQERVRFIFEDDQFQPKNTVSAVNKLIRDEHVDGLLIYGSPTSLAVNEIAEQAGCPMIALSIVERVVEGKKFVMKHWVPARTESELLAKEVRRRGYKKIAVLTAQNDAMLSLRDLFRSSGAGEIVLDEEFARENTDFRATISKLRGLKPDAVFSLLWAPQPGVFAKQLRELGVTAPMFGVHNLEDPNEVAVAGGALEGAWFVTADDRLAGPYLEAYRKKFGGDPTAGGANSYDIAKMFIEGVDAANLNDFLHSLKSFQGAFGVYGATAKNDFEISAAVKEITKDGFRTVSSPR